MGTGLPVYDAITGCNFFISGSQDIHVLACRDGKKNGTTNKPSMSWARTSQMNRGRNFVASTIESRVFSLSRSAEFDALCLARRQSAFRLARRHQSLFCIL